MQTTTNSSAFLYPGQGGTPSETCAYFSFLKNIDKERTEKYLKIAQIALREINPDLKYNFIQVLENNEVSAFQKTSFAQPVIYTLSIITNDLVKEKNYKQNFVLGHSLGAISALTTSGSLSFEEGVRVVAARGKFMQEASDESDTGLIAIIGLSEEQVLKICQETKTEIALFNAPTAFVIGGETKNFAAIEREAQALGARRALPLETSGAFHTKAMQSAYEKLGEFFSKINLQKPKVPVIMNIGSRDSLDVQEIKNDVIESMIKPVNWIKMINFVKEKTLDYYLESGPGTSLSSLSKMNGIPLEKIIHAKTILNAN